MSLIQRINFKLSKMKDITSSDTTNFESDSYDHHRQRTPRGKKEKRKTKQIELDDGYNKRVKEFKTKFPRGSLERLMANWAPVPTNKQMEDRYEFYYRPYNYACNINKYLTFDHVTENPFKAFAELEKEETEIEKFLRSKGKQRSGSEP